MNSDDWSVKLQTNTEAQNTTIYQSRIWVGQSVILASSHLWKLILMHSHM